MKFNYCIMDLKSYYYSERTEFALGEIGELRADILDLLNAFKGYQTKAFSIEQLHDITFTEAIRLQGFARYLDDFQGRQDQIFAPYRQLFHDITGVVLNLRAPFGQQHYRLLEISKKYEWAPQHAEIENIAQFILKNFKKYNNKKMLLEIYGRLSEVKKKGTLKPNSSAFVLYQIVRRKLPFWKRWI